MAATHRTKATLRRRAGVLLALLALACMFAPLFTASSADAPAADAKPSAYAPAKDLLDQVEYFVAQIEEDLADADDYTEYKQDRVAKDASTLAVLGLVLGMHDQDNPLKNSAPSLIAAAEDLAASSADHGQAKAALEKVKKTLEPAAEGSALKWKSVGDLPQLMKQVPIVNNNLRRGVTGRRFDRTVDRNAGYAATLAAIAQATANDTIYCSDKEDEAEWMKISTALRDAAAEVNVAVRRGDQEAATEALGRVVVTCDACHHRFRD